MSRAPSASENSPRDLLEVHGPHAGRYTCGLSNTSRDTMPVKEHEIRRVVVRDRVVQSNQRLPGKLQLTDTQVVQFFDLLRRVRGGPARSRTERFSWGACGQRPRPPCGRERGQHAHRQHGLLGMRRKSSRNVGIFSSKCTWISTIPSTETAGRGLAASGRRRDLRAHCAQRYGGGRGDRRLATGQDGRHGREIFLDFERKFKVAGADDMIRGSLARAMCAGLRAGWNRGDAIPPQRDPLRRPCVGYLAAESLRQEGPAQQRFWPVMGGTVGVLCAQRVPHPHSGRYQRGGIQRHGRDLLYPALTTRPDAARAGCTLPSSRWRGPAARPPPPQLLMREADPPRFHSRHRTRVGSRVPASRARP